MNPRHIPFLRIFVPWALGIAAGIWLAQPVPGLRYGLFFCLLLLFFLLRKRYAYRYRWVFGSLLFGTLLLAGYWYAWQHDERQESNHFSNQNSAISVFSGIVYDAPSKGKKLKIPLRLEASGPDLDSLQSCSGNVLLFLEPTTETEQIQYGDKLWVQATIQPAESVKNPHAFDYQQYLHFKNIHFQAFVKSESYGVIATGYGHLFRRMAFRWRTKLLKILRVHFPGRDEYAVAAALLVGHKDELSEELRASYAETGSMHVLAVSGTHVGLLYAGLLFLLQRIPWSGSIRRWGQTIFSLVGIWAFALVTGAAPSVMRAGVMFTAYLISKAIRRQASAWNILGGSAFLLLLIDPYMLCNVGFQLSFSAVAGIVFFYPILKKLTPSLPKWAGTGWDILLIGAAAQLGTLPLSLFYFHQFPVYFWLAGWVVMLGGAVFLWGGSILVLLSGLAATPAACLGWFLYHLIWGMNQAIALIQQLPGSVITGIWIEPWTAVLLGLFIWLFTWAVSQRLPRLLLISLALFATLGFCHFMQKHQQAKQQGIALYHVNRHFLLDFFHSDTRYTWADSLSERKEQFAARANRWAHGVQKATPLPGPKTPFRSKHLFVYPPFIQFFNLTLAVVDSPVLVKNNERQAVPVHVLVLNNNPWVRIGDCTRQFPCQLIVFTASNTLRRVQQWKLECQALGIPFYDVRERGAWEWEIIADD